LVGAAVGGAVAGAVLGVVALGWLWAKSNWSRKDEIDKIA